MSVGHGPCSSGVRSTSNVNDQCGHLGPIKAIERPWIALNVAGEGFASGRTPWLMERLIVEGRSPSCCARAAGSFFSVVKH